MNATVIRDRRETTLPADVCEAAGLHTNDQVEWRVEDGEIRGRKLGSDAPITLGTADVSSHGILRNDMKTTGDAVASALREERAEQ